MIGTTSAAFKRAFQQPAFLILVVILGACALTLNTAVARMKVHFKKQAVSLRVANLKVGIPEVLGNWVMVSKDQSIDPEVQQVLGTDEYVFRDYVDSGKVPASEIALMKDPAIPMHDRQQKIAEWQVKKPEAVIRAAVTYYTGLVDTVAHVPERCYVADGYDVTEYQTEHASLGNYDDGTPREVEFRYLNFQDQVGGQGVARNVAYVFHCNGSYDSNAYSVRQHLQDLFERYGYYAKIELMTASPDQSTLRSQGAPVNDREASLAAMEDFLAAALPQIEKCLPDWKALHAQPKK